VWGKKKIKMKKTQPNIELLTASLFGILIDTSVFPQIPSSLLDSGIVQIKKGAIAWCCSRLRGQGSQYSQVFLLLECGDFDVHIVKAGNQKFEEYPLAVTLQKVKLSLSMP
jgi:hypothetical protein